MERKPVVAKPVGESVSIALPNKALAAQAGDALWASLTPVTIPPHRARKGRIVSVARTDAAHLSFDVLRTKVLSTLRRNEWTSIGITSPTPGCGKTFIALNLAFSLASLDESRTVLVDLDLRRPRIGQLLAIKTPRSTADFIRGECRIEDACIRYGKSLAICPVGDAVPNSAELLQQQSMRVALQGLKDRLLPNVLLFDLPPMLGGDDTLAFASNVDCVMLVAGSEMTTVTELDFCERELAKETNVLGIVLNKSRYGTQQSGY